MTKEKDYFKTFCKIAKAFGTATTQPKLLDLVVQSAIDTMGGMGACLFLQDDKHDLFVPVAQSGLSENYLHASPLKVKAGGMIQALDEEGYLAFKDATKDPRLENHDAKKAEGIASILTVPVRCADVVIGVLSLYTATQRDFNAEEIEFLCALADQAGISIEKTRLLNRMQKNSVLFLDLASGINSSLDIRDILHNLTVNTCDTLGMKGAIIRLLDEESKTLKRVASHGLSEEFIEVGIQATTETAARALKGETIIIDDATTDERITFKEAMKKEGIVSMVVTPIYAKDEVIGVLRLYSATQRKFSSETLVTIEALAHHGGLAIQNASMYLELQKAKENLEEDIWSHRSWF